MAQAEKVILLLLSKGEFNLLNLFFTLNFTQSYTILHNLLLQYFQKLLLINIEIEKRKQFKLTLQNFFKMEERSFDNYYYKKQNSNLLVSDKGLGFYFFEYLKLV